MSADGTQQKNRKRTCDLDIPSLGLHAAGPLINQENIGLQFKRQADGLAFAGAQGRVQRRGHLSGTTTVEPWGRSTCPVADNRRCFRMLHFDQNGQRHDDPSVDGVQQIGLAQQDEVVERAGISNDDHASRPPVLEVRNRSSVARSLSRSSTV